MNRIISQNGKRIHVEGELAKNLPKVRHFNLGNEHFLVVTPKGDVVAAQSTKEGALHYYDNDKVLIELV